MPGAPAGRGLTRVRGARAHQERAHTYSTPSITERKRGAQVQLARGARTWGYGGRGAGRAHLRVVEQPQLVEPLRGGHGPAQLRPCCAPPAVAAASSAPPAGSPRPSPWAEGVTPGRSGAVLSGEVVLVPAALSHPSLHAPPPSRPAAAWLPALSCLHRCPASPRTVQRAWSPAGGGA